MDSHQINNVAVDGLAVNLSWNHCEKRMRKRQLESALVSDFLLLVSSL